MRFRTEIERVKTGFGIDHGTGVILTGSCFSDNMGQCLLRDGFDVTVNPLGPLYNPISLAGCLERALDGDYYSVADLAVGPRGFHCLDYATRYSGPDAAAVAADVNASLCCLREALLSERQRILFVTFGSAFVYCRSGIAVGNCHKFPSGEFERKRLSVSDILSLWQPLVQRLSALMPVVFTVSPIRHLADGLHGNELSKSTLLLAVDELCRLYPGSVAYFPAYEILIDDLRDYRF